MKGWWDKMEKLNLSSLLEDFIKVVSKSSIEVYNEAGIQFELAIFLREKIKEDYLIQLERNIDYFGMDKEEFLKKEMDIVVFSSDKKEKHCIELKFPTNGQYPEQMFNACKDVSFLEQLTEAGFDSSYFLFLTEDKNFYDSRHSRKNDGIYKLFRDQKEIKGKIEKPTGEKKQFLEIHGKYKINWKDLRGNLKYFVINVPKNSSYFHKKGGMNHV